VHAHEFGATVTEHPRTRALLGQGPERWSCALLCVWVAISASAAEAVETAASVGSVLPAGAAVVAPIAPAVADSGVAAGNGGDTQAAPLGLGDLTPETALFESLDDIRELTLEDILNAETTVAATTAQSLRVAAGVVTVLERADLVASGARDLIDVLHQVPGFSFGVDTEGVVGVAFRGNWGIEGKVLVLVDGHEMNETLYLTVPFGNELPIEHLERIEIIRGPGSVVYGGFAELAVINITTRRAETLAGPSLTLRGSILPDSNTFGRRSVGLSYGDTFRLAGDLRVAASAHLGDAVRSGAAQTDALGQSYSMAEGSRLRPTSLSFDVDWRGLTVGLRYQELRHLDRLGYGERLPFPVWGRFSGVYALASWTIKLPHGVTITPRLRWKRQMPWNITDTRPEVPESLPYDRSAQRWDLGLTATWEARPWFSLSTGGQYIHDRAWLNETGFAKRSDWGFFTVDGEPRSAIGFETHALFVEGTVRTVVDVTAGARYEHNGRYGASFVPRVALTRLVGGFNAKALLSQAFRAPGLENLSENSDLKPERATHFELEAGYLVAPWLHASMTGFAILIEKPIYYEYDPVTEVDTYVNGATAGTCGLEMQARLLRAGFSASFGYSLYTASCREQPSFVRVPGRPQALLGLANHKVTLAASWQPTAEVSVDPALTYLGSRWYAQPTATGVAQIREDPSVFLVDLFLTWRGRILRGGAVSLGIHNLLGQRFDFIQPYDGGMPPMRGLDREVTVRVSYDVP
jgi:outer membrane receptor for ferrienterochelin and colicins